MTDCLKQTISFMCLLLLVLTWTASSLLTHGEECLALLEFKENILHQSFASSAAGGIRKFESWRNITSNITSDGNSSDCCLWDGVECSSEGHVIGLDLSQSSLRGRINSHSTLFNLVYLQKLNLSTNDFSESQIPSEIARLKKLRILDLSYSGFSGQIPNEISHLVQLSVLDLSWNSLNLKSFSLEYLLHNLTRLEKLHLSKVDISSSIPYILANFSFLRSIDFEDCQLLDEFPSAVLHLPKLKYLSLRNNPNLTGSLPEFRNNTLLEDLRLDSTGFAGTIPGSISNLNHLVVLSLGRCKFSGSIPGSLSNLTQLTILGLGQNYLTGPVPSLITLSKLSVLVLSENKFENGYIPYWLSKLTWLNELYLNSMNISEKIPPSFANLTKLRVIKMRENYIFGQIPSSFMNLTQLVIVDLQRNRMQGPIPSSFSYFKSLEYLDLGFNNFSGRVNLDMFVGLDKLQSLYLSSNRISFVDNNNYTYFSLPQLLNLGLESCNLKEFPAFLRFQNEIGGLFLSRNKIDGLVPVWIWNNSRDTMQIFDISFNYITGFQRQPHFLPWVQLEELMIMNNQIQGRLPIPSHTTVSFDVSYNHLIGEIPSSICEAKNLQLLDLSSNNMTGTLPPCLGSLSSLIVLNLKRNNFHGAMINMSTHGSMLKKIDLSENQFTGQLSKSLTNCTNLEVLSLGDNSFTDLFPHWLGSLNELQVLILRYNKFQGPIKVPETNKPQFSNLRIIDLSNNGFSGQFPEKYFQSWNAMKSAYVGKSSSIKFYVDFGDFKQSYEYSMTLTNKGVKTEYQKILNIFTAIDLSCNKFEGRIPLAVQDLQGLESFNFSNNVLTGGILPSLGKLKNLESLDLSQNKLSGKIPQELLQLGFLAILNVSYNHLEGRIPQGKQFNTFENNSYMGNSELCGKPLSIECQYSKTSPLPPTSNNEPDSLLPSDISDWIVIFSGVACGLVIGLVVGNSLYARYIVISSFKYSDLEMTDAY